MKRIQCYMLTLLVVFSFHQASAQFCSGVTVEVFGANPQTGAVYEWGVNVRLRTPYTQQVSVTGTLKNSNGTGRPVPFSLAIPAGQLEANTGLILRTGPNDVGVATTSSIGPCPEVGAFYAGVLVSYETANGVLRFDNASDFNTVVDALDAAYENYNENYANQYPNLTPDQLDDVDDANNFDEFRDLRAFEQLFSGFASKRKQVEDIENAWLNSDFATPNPSASDQTADDALNTVMNGNGAFKIGDDVYQLNASGFTINGVPQLASNELRLPSQEELAEARAIEEAFAGQAGPSMSKDFFDDCRTNQKTTDERTIGNEKYKLEVAVHSIIIRSSAKVKVVHYKRKNSRWKRGRAEMRVNLAGWIRNTNCNTVAVVNDLKPAGTFSNVKSLKLVRREWNTVWTANSGGVPNGGLVGLFEQNNSINGYGVALDH